MTEAQKNTLYYYIGKALSEKVEIQSPLASIKSFNDEQQKVLYYLVGTALVEHDMSILEIVKGDN